MKPEEYGRYYYCVKVPTNISKRGEIYIWVDYVTVTDCGVLILVGQGEKNTPLLSLAPGQWIAFYAASVIDGSAVAVEHWEGEIVEA